MTSFKNMAPKTKLSCLIVGGMVTVWVALVLVTWMFRADTIDPSVQILNRYESLKTALRNRDLPRLESVVDLEKVAHNAVSSVLITLDTPKESTPLLNVARLQLSHQLLRDIRQFFHKQDHSMPDENSLFGRLYHTVVHDAAHFKRAETQIIERDETSALLETTWIRTDLDVTLPLMLRLENQAGHGWRFVEITTLNHAVQLVEDKKTALLQEENARIIADMNTRLTLETAEVSKALPTENKTAKTVMVRLAFRNNGAETIEAFHARLSFMGVDGTVYKEMMVSDTDPIAAGNSSEKSWPVQLDTQVESEQALLNEANEAIHVDLTLERIQLKGGMVLEPLNLLTSEPTEKENAV